MKNNTSNHPHYSVVAFASNGKVYGYAELICDEVADLDYLPTENTKIAVGSKCTCLANGKVYTLSNARQWVEDLSNQSDGTDEVYDPLEVSENGDVVVTYNGMKIAATEESGHITLETSGKRVEHDIELEYTKPAGGIRLPEIIITKPSGSNLLPRYFDNGSILYATNDGLIANESGLTDESKIYGVPVYRNDSYKLDFQIESVENNYNVTVNGNAISFDADMGGYIYSYSSSTYPEGFTIVITNKE